MASRGPPLRQLLITFDAFGTLIRPRRPVPEQYVEVARSFGLFGGGGITAGDVDSPIVLREHAQRVEDSFRVAFKNEKAAHPNYGKVSGMTPAMWWTEVITNTLKPLLKQGEELPPALAPALLHRFSTGEGYELVDPDLGQRIRELRTAMMDSAREDRVDGGGRAQALIDGLVVGVLTNSDDRVASVLSSLGLNVSPLRHVHERSYHRQEPPRSHHSYSNSSDGDAGNNRHDIDFVCTSYDTGVEKPHRDVFDSAHAGLAKEVMDSRRRAAGATDHELADMFNGNHRRFYRAALDGPTRPKIPDDMPHLWVRSKYWARIHVGDDLATDVAGALAANWSPVWVGGDGDGDDIPGSSCAHDGDDAGSLGRKDLKTPMMTFGSLAEFPAWGRGARTKSAGELLRWLTGDPDTVLWDRTPNLPN